MKLYYRSGLLWNQIYFLIVSIVFLYAISTIGSSQSPFSFINLQSYLVTNKLLIGFAGVVGIFIFLSKKVSQVLFFSYGLTCFSYAIYILIYDFSKISAVLTSIFLILFYYFYQLLSFELKKAYRNSLFKRNEVFEPLLKKIPVTLYATDNTKLSGYLINWDEDSCYVKITSGELVPGIKEYDVFTQFKGYKLEDVAVLATADLEHKEIGLKFDEESSSFGWRHFSDIIEMLGYKVEYLK